MSFDLRQSDCISLDNSRNCARICVICIKMRVYVAQGSCTSLTSAPRSLVCS